jgi:hypothetical protein
MKLRATFLYLLVCIASQAESPHSIKVQPKQEAKKVWPKYPSSQDVASAMKKATLFMRSQASFAGGYAWSWPTDFSTAKGEDRDSPSLVMIQPPGTPSVGLAMLEAYRVTGDKLYLQGAKEAAQCLLWCQLASGGWTADFDFHSDQARRTHFRRDLDAGDTERGGRSSLTTLDDDKTQSALLFLLELAHSPDGKTDAELNRALDFGLDSLLAAQAGNGAWPQRFSGPAEAKQPTVKASIPKDWPRKWPNVDYTSYYTLNDGNLLRAVQLLRRAYELSRQERYLAAIRRVGSFLIAAQLPAPQAAWAQQYNEPMQPVWARKFEPPAVSSVESIGALYTLVEIWLATGDESFLKPVAPALDWLQRSKLPEGTWARFYELESNKPLYCKKDSYELTYEDKDLPTHYGFKADDSAAKKLAELQEFIALGHAGALAKRALPDTAKDWTSKAKGAAGKTVTALTTQDKKGYWKEDGLISAGLYVKHMKAMTLYLEASQKGAALFEKLRSEQK